jgi:predicted ATPase/DNA-binding XRE family transcriptional regulator
MAETKSFGQWLRHRRREFDLTQEELANQVGCAPITVRKIEADQMRPSKQLAHLLLERLGVASQERAELVRIARGGELIGTAVAAFPRNNLPHPISFFIGRDREIAEIAHLLTASRLVTLTGAGGCGKSRMALEVADRVLDHYPDGIWFVPLASLAQPSLVLQAIASALEVREVPAHALAETLASYLHSRRMLLLLDNCEHLIEACAQAADQLLQTCPDLRLLATSREPLGIQGEAQYHVPSLSLPDEDSDPSLESISRSEAVRLFMDRAALVDHTFQISAANYQAIAQICRRLDGMPLAVELAAALVRSLGIDHILEGLDDRFNLLTSGIRAAPQRQQTLRAAMDWSYDLLSREAQQLFVRLSVFSGGFGPKATKAICCDESLSEAAVATQLVSLVNRSLIEVQGGGDQRYRMLETIRLYAAGKLRESGEEPLLRARHLGHFASWAEQVEPELRGLDGLTWCDRIQVEHDNVRAALQWALRSGNLDAGLRLAGSMAQYWQERCYWKEGLRVLKALLASPLPAEANPTRAKALVAAAALSVLLATSDPADEWFSDALQICTGLGDSWWIAYTLNGWGWHDLYKSNAAAGRARFEQAVAYARSSGDPWMLGTALKGLGAAVQRLDYAAARTILAQSIAIWRRIGNREGLADALNQLATVAHGLHEEQEAVILFEESLAIFRDIRSTANIAMVLCMLGFAVQARGENERARGLLEESLVLARDSGYDHEAAASLAGLGGVAAAEHNPKLAARLLGAAAAWRELVGEDLAAWPYVLPDYERWEAAARAQLGDAAFFASLDEGRAMTLDRAAHYALADVITVPRSTLN